MPRPERYNRQLEAIRNTLSRLFENAGAVILGPRNVLPDHIEVMDGRGVLYHSGHHWLYQLQQLPGVVDAGVMWTDAVRRFAIAITVMQLEDIVFDEDLQIMAEADEREVRLME